MEDTIIKALLLGYAHIECNGTPIRICLKKAQGLLFYLLVHKKATRDELTGLLWGGEDNELARRHLRDNLYHLKKVVPIELVVPAGRSAIQLNPELGFYIDVDEFLKAVDVEAYQGEFLKGFSVPNCYEYEEWLERTRTSLREAYLQQLDKRAEFCLSEGKDGEAEALWRKYLQEEPLCETVSISLMRFYRAQKDYNRAALIYRGLHKAMADTLGIAPLKDTSELYYSIMKEWNEQSENGEISDDFLVGRQNQLQYLLHLFSRMHTSKHARSFVILGEAGVGKTHLLSYFLSHGEVSSYEIITTSCFKSKQDEYLYPWQTIMLSLSNFIEKESIPIPNAYMQAVSALFPMIGEFGSADVRKKAHLLVDSVMGFDSVLTVLTLASKKKPLLLVVEDIQWIDSMSLALLDQALHKIGPEKFVFAATCRQPCGKEVERFLRNVEEDELCSLLSLAAFTYEETMQFIELCGARGIVLQDKDRIYHDTQGNAFLLTQLIGSIMENGQPKVLPHSMDEILSYRLSGLSFEGRQVLNLVAMFPDYAPYRVLEVVSSKPTLDLLYVCQELCRRAILMASRNSIDLDNKYIVLDLSGMPDDMIADGTFWATSIAYDLIMSCESDLSALLADELWSLVGATANPQAAGFVLEMVKTIRGLGGIAVTSTQGMQDLFGLDGGSYGKGILDASRIKLVMQMEEQEARLIQDKLNLSEDEVRQITRFRRGEGLLCIGYNHVPVAFHTTPKEYEAITTSPTDLRRGRSEYGDE